MCKDVVEHRSVDTENANSQFYFLNWHYEYLWYRVLPNTVHLHTVLCICYNRE